MKNTLLHIADCIGLGTLLTYGFMNIIELIKAIDYNKTVLALTALGSLIWVILKIINIHLSNKKLRLETEKLKG